MKEKLFKKRINKLCKTGDWSEFFNNILNDQTAERKSKNVKKNN
jgi:hypothetical protein